MVSDRIRTDSFARGIAQVVKKGDVVLDIGTGTGILAMLAARAGARKVYAVDQSDIAKTAELLVKTNGLEEIVQVVYGPAGSLDFEEKVDVIMSEWLGHFAFVEAMLDDVIIARDAHLAPGGRMLPSSVDVMLAPIDDSVLYIYDGPGFWRGKVQGFDFSSLEGAELQQARAIQRRVAPAALLSPGRSVSSLDLSSCRRDEQWNSGLLEFQVQRDGMLNGFVGWFDIQLSAGERLSTGTDKPETHWYQTYLPFIPQRVSQGMTLPVEYVMERDRGSRRNVKLTLSVNGARQSYVLE
jgi:SAM-dependent methyltransferase